MYAIVSFAHGCVFRPHFERSAHFDVSHFADNDGRPSTPVPDPLDSQNPGGSSQVVVKSQGDFEQLLLVRIDESFGPTSKLFNRNELSGGEGRILRARLRE